MKIWHKFPMLRLLIPFLFGIIFAITFDVEKNISLLIYFTLLTFISLIVFLPHKFYNFKYRWVFGICIFIFLFLFGFQMTIIKTSKFDKNNCSHLPEKKYSIITNVVEPPTEKQNSYKITGEIVSIKTDSVWKEFSGKVIFYFKKDSLAKTIKYGDRLLLKTFLNHIKPPQNPAEFDYRSYLQKKGIYQQAYIDGDFSKILNQNKANFLFRTAYNLREKFFKLLKKNDVTGDEFAVASALLLGYDDKLDTELKQDFAGAGAMHILCVSGLHVGIIYLVLSNLLFFLQKKKYGKIIRAILLLLLIWFYALLTGLAPSVSRASTMISFIIIGKAMQKESNVFNNLAASAFLLLIVNPYTITAVGFQLSYTAVVAILIIQPPLQKLIVFNNWFGEKAWAITTVSIAAQIGTFPLSIYYFHQFPNYFLLTNLIVIPLSFFIIASGIIFVIFSFSGFLSMIFSKVLLLLIYILNSSVSFIGNLPNSTTFGISINTIEFFLIYIIIISVIIYLSIQKKIYFFFVMIAIFFLVGISTFKNHSYLKQRKIIVYNIRKHSAIDLINGKENIFITDSILFNDENKINYHLQNHWWKLDLTKTKKVNADEDIQEPGNNSIFKSGNFIQFFDKRILILDKDFRIFPNSKKLKIDYAIISNNPKIKIREIKKYLEIGLIIIDASNSRWNEKQWIKECNQEKIKYHSVISSGAIVINF
ncbi:MAG: ComEC family competence protein [Bacteroidales bacterium]|nr:ComEC family competence protein [Bacteroidales bacterium]